MGEAPASPFPMQTAEQVQVGRPPTQEELDAWYEKQGLKADKDGIFTSMPYSDAPVHRDVILEQVATNSLRRDVPNLPTREYTPKTFVYVGGGPSIKHFLNDIKEKCESDKYDVVTSNKTCSYLLSQGIKPNYHLILDPTEKKVKDLGYEENVELYLGLQCHPSLFERAKEKGAKAWKFLAASITNEDGRTDRDAAKEAAHPADPIIMGIGGGSMCGTRMLYFAAARGYRRIEFYGVDGSIDMQDNKINCYAYFKPRGENIIETTAENGRTFYTTITLARQADELVQMMDILPGMDVEIYGDTLMANHLATYKELRKGLPVRITPEYLEMQRHMHHNCARYGNSAAQHAARVFMAAAQIHRQIGVCSVLDYGSAGGLLKKSIEKAFPSIPGIDIAEYDPCVDGKDSDPAPADLLYCGDVLEHVEPECIRAVMEHIASLTKHLGIFVIALTEAKKTLPDGRNAHICLQKPNWWLSWLRKHFIVIEEHKFETEMIVVAAKIQK
jgi:hypothetical protein